MTFSDLAALGGFVSGLAVLASLAYLNVQVRQSTKHSRAVIQQARAARMFDQAWRFAESDYGATMVPFVEGKISADVESFSRFQSRFRASMYSAEDTFFQYREGLLHADAFVTFERAIVSAMQLPGFRRMWKLLRTEYGPGFQEFMDGIVVKADAVSGPSLLEQWNALAADQNESK